jgi:16S rRNA (guanine966-N2)-methyltransferase
MRIVAGEYGGRRIKAPRGNATRPTADRVREALFSSLGDLTGAVVLDLFAGSGALGLEALSRGAAHATFVDSDSRAVAAVKANLEALGIAGDRAAVQRRAHAAHLHTARPRGRQYDLVLLDPPYRLAPELGRELSEELPSLLRPGARVVAESDRRAPLELELPLTTERRYGDTLIRIHETHDA